MSEEVPPSQHPPFEDVVALDVEGYLPDYQSDDDFVRGHEHPEEWEPAVIAVAYRPAMSEGWIEHYHDFGGSPSPDQVIDHTMECIRQEVSEEAKIITYNGSRYDIRMMSSTSDITPLLGREHYDLHRWIELLDRRKMSLNEALERHGAAIDVNKPNQAARIAEDIAKGRPNGEVLKLLKYLTADVCRLPELADKLIRRFSQVDQEPPTSTIQDVTGNSHDPAIDNVATDGGKNN